MPNFNRSEYGLLKDFFSFYVHMRMEASPPEEPQRALNNLEALENKSPRMALQGLRQAINDCVEESWHFDPAKVAALDAELINRGIITLSELRRRYSRGYTKVLKRGRIKNDTEFYLLQNVINDPSEKTSEERELLAKLLSDYEGA
ncbi:hypothetical protein [Bradyrhizobium sp. NAS96.2]|uniref:hypothetical protein n=1 Tax=Bradyrhizobium sp. NAS96.2 TaxID=1680160 RepID=UPI00093C8A63|nr:hypothetical protein [Bradyrhizobium sp. NAS96.2]OKO74252.1 hypothetical protein AC628_22925 [Bradyrhizobium sp. NAS96.2]